jgi:serine/threonine protein kinase
MGMAEIRDAFEAYASGELAEQELRGAIRAAIDSQPDSIPGYVAMAAALRRRQLISAELEAAVISDMQARADRAAVSENSVLDPDAAANEDLTKARTKAPALARSTGPAGAWDTVEKLAEPEAEVKVGLVLRERFELVEELGCGGMGVVYKALDQREIENHGREPYVAIKVLNEDFKRHPESARALQRESKKAMRLAHPNIVLVRDFDRDRGNVYMVMELLHGQPIDQLIHNSYPNGMPLEEAVRIVRGLGAALSYAHQEGIVHADFKPSNTFLTSKNVVKVLDFGVARAALALDRGDSTLFDAGKLNAVSPAYASIEMLIGEAPDARDDIYAFACVTYFLLTGRHPFNGIDAIKARDAGLTPPRVKGLAEHQWRALRSGLIFERWDRTPSVKAFVDLFCSDRSDRARRLAIAASARAGRLANAAVAGAGKVTGAAVAGSAAVRNAAKSSVTAASHATIASVTRITNAVKTQVRRVIDTIASRPVLVAGPAGAALGAALLIVGAHEWSLHRPVAATPGPEAAVRETATPVEKYSALPAPAPAPIVTQVAAPVAASLPAPVPSVASASTPAPASTQQASAAVPAAPPAVSAQNSQQQLIQNFIEQARQQMESGNTTAALATIASARRKYAGAPALKNLEIVYDRVEEEVARINMAPTLNLQNHAAWIAEIRDLSGEDFPAINQMLARALANDIADQRARADRPAVIARLLESGRKLFPEYADELEHGTAGVLDASQLVVGEEADSPAAASPSLAASAPETETSPAAASSQSVAENTAAK